MGLCPWCQIKHIPFCSSPWSCFFLVPPQYQAFSLSFILSQLHFLVFALLNFFPHCSSGVWAALHQNKPAPSQHCSQLQISTVLFQDSWKNSLWLVWSHYISIQLQWRPLFGVLFLSPQAQSLFWFVWCFSWRCVKLVGILVRSLVCFMNSATTGKWSYTESCSCHWM